MKKLLLLSSITVVLLLVTVISFVSVSPIPAAGIPSLFLANAKAPILSEQSIGFAPNAPGKQPLISSGVINAVHILSAKKTQDDTVTLTIFQKQKDKCIIAELPFYPCGRNTSYKANGKELYQLSIAFTETQLGKQVVEQNFPNLAANCSPAELNGITRSKPITRQILADAFMRGKSPSGKSPFALFGITTISLDGALFVYDMNTDL